MQRFSQASLSIFLYAILAMFFSLGVLVLFVHPTTANAAGPISTFATTTAAGNDDAWYGVTYGNGKFVAVAAGASGDHVMYSTDGVTWAATSAAGNDDTWVSITYGNGRFVAVGDYTVGDGVMYSTDGITWATTSAAGNNDAWFSVAYGNGRFVAVGAFGDRAMYSTDGITWATTTAAGNNDAWFSVAYGNGRFVAVGDGADRVMYSTDGIAWATTSAAGNNDNWYDVTYGNGRFVAVGNSAVDNVMYSTDGITWATTSAAGNNDEWQSVVYGNGRFVAVGAYASNDRVIYSTDGVTWTIASAAGDNDTWLAVTYGNSMFVAVGSFGDRVMYADSTHPLVQSGFRFRDDNGSETGASYLGAQNANTTAPLNDPLRLRTQIEATDEAVANQYYVQYKKTSDSVWSTIGLDGDFPVVITATSGRSVGNATSHNVILPVCDAGNLLLTVFSYDATGPASTLSAGWNKMGEALNGIIVSGAVFWKISDSPYQTLSVTLAATQEASYITYCIANAGTPVGRVTNGSGTNSNPIVLNAGANRNHLWIATRSGDAQVAATAAPAGFFNLLSVTANTTGGATTNTAHTYLFSSTTDPGTFTSLTEQWVSWTIAVPPKDTSTVRNLAVSSKASTTGANNTGYGSIAWTNPTQASSSNNLRASVTLSSTTATNHLYLTDWGFNIPENATILGIEAYLEKIQSGGTLGNTRDNSVRLIKNGTTTGSSNLGLTAANWSTTEWVTPYGSSTELWGLTWTPADINATNFGVAIAAQGAAAGANRIANIDHAIMNVYYTVPSNIMLASSTNIANGGASTTGQLIAPGALSTTDFSGGHITDDQNVTPIVNTAAAKYTELEWNLIATGTATTGDAYQLRTVSAQGEVLGDYDANALWTLGEVVTPGTFTLSGNLLNAYGTTTSPGAGVQVVAAVNQDGNPVLYSTTTTAGGAYTLSVATGTAPGTSWNAVLAAGGEDSWKSVAYGNGRFVAVGISPGTDRVMYSTDGINWATTSAAGNDDDWEGVVYGNGIFVAVGSHPGTDRVMYSTDGINWATTSAAGNDDSWQSVIYGNGRFVAVGVGTDRVMYSDDGINWTTTSAAGDNDFWKEVTYGNGRFVAVASGIDILMYSDDGINWATATPPGPTNYLNGITYGNGRFVAVGGYSAGDNRVVYSSDGITWASSSALGNSDYWQSVTYGNGRFVAVSNSGPSDVMYSTDGITWVSSSGLGTSGSWTSVTYGNGRFVAVGLIEPVLVSDAGLGSDTGYTIYSKSSTTAATTFLMGASGASAQRADLFRNTLAIYNATTNAASSTTEIGNAAFYDSNNDADVLYEFADGYFVAASDLLTATGTVETNLPLLITDDVAVYGTFDLTGSGAGSLELGSILGSLDITSGGVVRAPYAMYVTGDFNNSGTFTRNASGTVAFGGKMGYSIKHPYFQNATTTLGVHQGLFMSDDGTKLYKAGFNEVQEYTLDTPFDLSSGSYTAIVYPESSITIQGLTFANDGRKMYINGWQNDIVDEFTLATPWDLSTAMFTASSSFGNDNFPVSMYMSNDGRNFYISDNNPTDAMRWYTLSTPYSIQSAVLQASSTSLFEYGAARLPFQVSSDGEYFIVYNGFSFTKHQMMTPWNLSTIVTTTEESGSFLELYRGNRDPGYGAWWLSNDGTIALVAAESSIAAVYTLGAELSGAMTGSSSLPSVLFGSGKSVFTAAASTTNFEVGVGALVEAPTTTLSVTGNYTNNGTADHASLDGTLVVSGANAIVFGATNSTSSFNNLVITGSTTITDLGTTTVRNLTINPGATLGFASAGVLEVFGNYINNGTATLPTTAVVSAGKGFDLRDAVRESMFDGSGTLSAVAFSATGTFMYIVEEALNQVLAYRLGVPWEVSTASYLYATSVAGYIADPEPTSLQFKSDGTRMFLFEYNNLEVEYLLTTPWDIRTATFVATTSLDGCCGNIEFAFSPDGTKYYRADAAGSGAIDQYTLATPWTLSTATYNATFVGRGATYADDFAVSPDGMTLVVGVTGDQIRQFRMLAPHDISTAQEVGDLSASDIDDGLAQITFNASGTKMYVFESFNDDVHQYDLTDSYTFSGNMTGASSFDGFRATGTLPVIFADAASTSDFIIATSSIVLAPTSTLLISGNFENRGTFIPRAGTTTLAGAGKTITGSLTSFDTTTNSPDYGLTNITGTYTYIGSGTTSALTINTGGSLTAPSSGSLVVAHDFTNNGTYTNNGATTTLGGNLRSGATGTNALGNIAINARSLGFEWQAIATSSALGNNDTWSDVVYGNGRFVVVGGNADGSPDTYAAYSADGLTWTAASASSNAWSSVAYGNGIFVAVTAYGGGPMMTSPDGITWTNRSPSGIGSTWSDITFGNGRFVAVGFSGTRVMYSDDGINWATTSAAGNNDNWFSVTYGDGKFVAVGNQFDGDVVMYSYDGVTWATTSVSGVGSSIYTKVAYGNGRFVAVAAYDEGGPVIYSLDGINWVKVPDAPNEDWNALTYGNGYFVAGSSNGLMYSTDGVSWTAFTAPENNSDIRGITYGSGRFVATSCGGPSGCGTTGNRIITALPVTNLFANASTSNLTIATSSTLNASGTTVSVANNYTNNGTLTASSSTFVFNGTSAQVATGTMSSSSRFFNLRLENTSGNGTTSRSVTFGAPLTASGTMTMIASTSAGFLANATTTLQNVSWQGSATSPVWLRSTATGTQWYLDIPGSQLTVDYVNVRDSNATGTVGGVTPTNSTDVGNNTNWNFGAAGPSVWNASDWLLYDTITINQNNIDDDLTDFPVYVNLDDLSSTFWATTPGSAALVGTDIRVTTNANVEVPRELVFASSTTQTGELHFKAPAISSTTDTVFKIWYNGNTMGDYADTATYGAENVWTNQYLSVYHLDEDPSLAGVGGIIDSSSNANDGTDQGSMDSSDKVIGKNGYALDFDGINDTINLTNIGSFTTGPFTMSSWSKTLASTTQMRMISKYDSGTNQWGLISNSADGSVTAGLHDGSNWNTSANRTKNWADGAWRYVVGVVDTANITSFTNGVATTSDNHDNSFAIPSAVWTIGSLSNSSEYFSGQIDEVRVSSAARSSAWIKAEYYNQSTSTDFYTVNLTGSTTILAHTAGQVSNAFSNRNQTDAALFAFRLQPNSGVATVTNAVFTLAGAQKVDAANFSNLRLLRDVDNDATYDATDVAVGGSGSMVLNGQSGTITFTADFLSTTTQNYLLVGDFTAPANGSFLTINFPGTGLTVVDATGTQTIFGTITGIQHNRNNKGGGSGSGAIGGDAPAGQGSQGGGGGGGGQLIGDDPSFQWPSANSGSWTNPGNAYDRTDGTYATTGSVNNHDFSNHVFGVPVSNSITGIEVKLEVSGTTGQGSIDVALSWNGGTNFTTIKSTPTLTTSDVVVSLGGATDLWGRSWSTSEFSDSNFRVRLTGQPVSNTVRVDAIQVRVYHQAGGGGGGGGGEI